MKSFSLKTFGCKTNQYEGEALRELLILQGLEEVAEKADFFIINACSVTAKANKEWFKFARKLKEENPASFLVLTGCYPPQSAELEELKKYFHLIIGFGERNNLPGLLRSETVGYFESNLAVFEPLTVKAPKGHTRAFLKVEDGCHLSCSYCIVPLLRGSRIRSKPLDEVKEEFLRLLQNGFYEVVLTGTHLGAYGFDYRLKLTDLINELLDINHLFRLRLSSIEPQEVSGELLELMKNDSRIARHLHLPMQSGSPSILKAMRRLYTPEDYLRLVEKARTYLPDIGISTDIIVGFPGEKEDDFVSTLWMLDSINFVKVHLFPFSPRPHTLANNLPQVNRAIIKERMKLAQVKAEESLNRYADNFVGKILEVLTEKKAGQFYEGYSSQYLKVHFLVLNKEEGVLNDSDEYERERNLGEVYKVIIAKVTGNYLEGVVKS
ncbi:MAG: Threonylcarbamoyladenosine tRNA methylthiotransferase MtaB [candidate division WS2 bacterium]|nr:Threonylcarbamoyladenosine tRNA methylthiotransferase MtaB [Candidatus Lithacetigena glycinireducens]